jgi:predicted lipoprotein with Yx(FWY)xxD motif
VPAHASSATSATVVHVATRAPFGKILTNDAGRSLYYKPTGTCTGTCLSFWPPLLMPKGTTTPLGAKCLTTVAFGTSRLQVEYMKHRLYTFTSDSGTSVNGNGIEGFVVAKVTATCP